jgi:hypothetical protein
MKFPEHKASMHLMHNDHLANYSTVKQAIENEDHCYREECWISEEEKQKAIETNECWSLQWYPDTPVGFYIQSASNLEVLLNYIENNKGEY